MLLPTIYAAAGLFNVAERARNAALAVALRNINLKVIEPQVEAKKFHDAATGQFDLDGIVAECKKMSADKNNIVLACLDGTSADDGGSVEFGIGWGVTGRAIGWRSDFRTHLPSETGVNGMFRSKENRLIYLPCFATTPKEFDKYFRELAKLVKAAMLDLHKEGRLIVN